jgi:hypothetical protein
LVFVRKLVFQGDALGTTPILFHEAGNGIAESREKLVFHLGEAGVGFAVRIIRVALVARIVLYHRIFSTVLRTRGKGRVFGRLVKNFTSSQALEGMEAPTPWGRSKKF